MELSKPEELKHAIAALAAGSTEAIDRLTWTGVFGTGELRDAARTALMDRAREAGLYPASIHDLYLARGRGETPHDFTVPAINIRGASYETARALFRARRRLDAGAVICEIARSEISYTDQRPAEYAFVVMAAALREGWKGPVFLQGDHFQINAKKFAVDPVPELKTVLELAEEALRAGFYNIDVDTSTLVDLSKPTLEEQQAENGARCAEITAFIRAHEPRGVTVSVGGEIGEVGGKNSTPEELRAFVKMYEQALHRHSASAAGMSKISIQTGTSHGGVPLPDGTVAKVQIDFDALEKCSKIAREEYGMAGAVQHGASTLPAELFNHFPKRGACEVHLATEFQNMLFDHPAFPADLKRRIYDRLRTEEAADRKPSDTDEQFFYKVRKKALGSHKRDLWTIAAAGRETIGRALEDRFAFLIEQLHVARTREMAERWAPFVAGSFPQLGATPVTARGPEDVAGLSD